MGGPVRRNFAHLTDAERQAYVNAVRNIDLQKFSDDVSWWDKHDQIHQATHSHQGPNFIPWHRELCNRYEKLLQAVDPSVALHYWDWTEHPTAASDQGGNPVNLCTDTLMGTAVGVVAGTLAPLHNGDNLSGSRDSTGDFRDPPRAIRRNCGAGAPTSTSDDTLLHGADALPEGQQWASFRTAVEGVHDDAHVFFGSGSNIRDPHSAFEDPFVFLLHSNVDRLFAEWQTDPAFPWRLDPDRVYGNERNTTGDDGILETLAPWDGTADFGSPIPPWTPGSADVDVKNSRHPSVVRPPCYDTLPTTVTQAGPTPPEPIRFIDVPEGQQTARGLRLRVASCRPVTCTATLTGDAAFSLLQATVSSPDTEGFEVRDLLVWVVFTGGAPESTASGTLQAVLDTGQSFSVDIVANSIAKPTVAASLVLDRSASMAEPSGVPEKFRMQVLKEAAPILVDLLYDDDGIGVVAFDTDAVPTSGLSEALPLGAGGGRDDAIGAIDQHDTNPGGLTAIGDGIEAAATQLSGAGAFVHRATVVFTDGHETAPKYIHQVTDLINSRVYAVGLGTAAQLNPGALGQVAAGTDGYLLLTGNPGPDDDRLLQKYFSQVAAGVTNDVIVTDPDGHVPPGGEAVVPYPLTEADTHHDVIVLSPAARFLDVVLEAPDGSRFDAGSVTSSTTRQHYRILRAELSTLPGAPRISGTWKARLCLRRPEFRKALKAVRKEATSAAARMEAHGVPFTLAVHARSSVRLAAEVRQTSRFPGSTATLRATPTQYGIPLMGHAVVDAVVTDPSGAVSTVRMTEGRDADHTADLPTPVSGVYRVLFRATGTTFRGEPFTRDELRTVPVWRPEESPPDPGTEGTSASWCDLLACLLSDQGVERWAKRNKIDLHHVRECVKRLCH